MAYPDGALLKSNDQPEVWLIQDGQRHWIPSPDVFNADGFSWAAVLVISDAEIAAIPQGPDVPLYTSWITPGPNDPVLPGPQLPTVEYNGVDYKRWQSGGGGHTIYGRAQYVTQTGAISGETITTNGVMFTGYHSGTSALITNTNNIVVYSSPVFRVGVNARGTGPNVVSTNAWSFNIPPASRIRQRDSRSRYPTLPIAWTRYCQSPSELSLRTLCPPSLQSAH